MHAVYKENGKPNIQINDEVDETNDISVNQIADVSHNSVKDLINQ